MNIKSKIAFILLFVSLPSFLTFNCSDIQSYSHCSQSISCAWNGFICEGEINPNCNFLLFFSFINTGFENCIYVQNIDSSIQGNGSLEFPFSTLDQALSNTITSSVIVLINIQNDSFKVADSHNLFNNITIRYYK